MLRRIGFASILASGMSLIVGCGGSATGLGSVGLEGFAPGPAGGWHRADPSGFVAPGTVLAAWKGDDGSSIVVYRTSPIPRADVGALADELVNRFESFPGTVIRSRGVAQVGGFPAARVEFDAPGTGDALAPTGLGRPVDSRGRTLVPTRRVTLGIPKSWDTVWIVWHFPLRGKDPGAETERIRAAVDATLAGVRLRP